MLRSNSSPNSSTMSVMQSLSSLLQRVQIFGAVEDASPINSPEDCTFEAQYSNLQNKLKSTISKPIPYNQGYSKGAMIEGSLESQFENSLEDSPYSDSYDYSQNFTQSDSSEYRESDEFDEDHYGSCEEDSIVDTPKSLPEISLCEVAQHDTYHDCWIVFYDKVYDVTSFLYDHPGGEDILMEHAGRDGTLAFRSVGHSKAALASLQEFIIGTLPAHERIFNGWENN